MAHIRQSKFKHVFGKPLKRDECYDCIRISSNSIDSKFCSVNPKYLAIITEAAGGGAFLVIPLEKTGRQEAEIALVAGHKGAVLDIQFCPHNDDVIASASDDCTIKVWNIPENWLKDKTNLTEPIADLVGHQRRVVLVQWHPTVENLLLSSGADNLVKLWNIETEEELVEISFPEMIISASFNYDGSKLVTTCKDKMTRVVDPRTGEIKAEGKCHEGSKPQQVVYLKGDRFLTTGFSRMSERQYALWDDTNLSSSVFSEDLDTSNGVIFPYYDPDTNLIFLTGKGDSVIKYFEYNQEEAKIYYINRIDSSDPQRGNCWMPKRGVDVNQNEIARCYKLHNKNLCEVIPFTVPRKSELYQDDLYPDTAGYTAAMTVDEWLAGKNASPILMSLREGFVAKERIKKGMLGVAAARPKKDLIKVVTTAPVAKEEHKTERKEILKTEHKVEHKVEHKPTHQGGNEMTTTSSKDSEDMEHLRSEILKLKSTVRELCERVTVLEEARKNELDDIDACTMDDN